MNSKIVTHHSGKATRMSSRMSTTIRFREKHAGSSNCNAGHLSTIRQLLAGGAPGSGRFGFEEFPHLQWSLHKDKLDINNWLCYCSSPTTAAQAQQRGTTTTEVKTPSNKQQGRLAAQWRSKAHEEPDVNHLSVREMHTGHSNYNGSNFSTVRLLLAGGAQGSSTTKRKRWNHERQTTNNASDDNSRAQALVQVLHHWQPQPNWQGNNRKRQKQTTTRVVTTTSRPKPSLREQPLAVLKTKNKRLAGAISTILQPYVGTNQHLK